MVRKVDNVLFKKTQSQVIRVLPLDASPNRELDGIKLRNQHSSEKNNNTVNRDLSPKQPPEIKSENVDEDGSDFDEDKLTNSKEIELK